MPMVMQLSKLFNVNILELLSIIKISKGIGILNRAKRFLFNESLLIAGLLRPQNYLIAANLSTNISFGSDVVYDQIKHLRYEDTAR